MLLTWFLKSCQPCQQVDLSGLGPHEMIQFVGHLKGDSGQGLSDFILDFFCGMVSEYNAKNNRQEEDKSSKCEYKKSSESDHVCPQE
ncbi:hypothetical protein D3C73_1383880 [compost metagenome]